MSIIIDVDARQVYDSRGIPTIAAKVLLKGGASGQFITPSGASTGAKEALELRDNDKSRFLGKGVSKAIENVKGPIKNALISKEFKSQQELDDVLLMLDKSPLKSNLGANAILAVSGAFFKAIAKEQNLHLYERPGGNQQYKIPVPMINVINGGAHADNGLDIQEFMLLPKEKSSLSESLRKSAEVFYHLKNYLKSLGKSTAVGDEGGFAPSLRSNYEALDILCTAIQKAGYEIKKDFDLALDVAANELYTRDKNIYTLDNKNFTTDSLIKWYEDLIRNYPIKSIEDPFFEDDYEGFRNLTYVIGDKIQIVGDDLFVTNEKIIKTGITEKLANAVLIKMNQIGTITETLTAVNTAKTGNFNIIISHRSGETEDTTIADLAVLTSAQYIKTGSMSRSERLSKYNRLLEIELELKS